MKRMCRTFVPYDAHHRAVVWGLVLGLVLLQALLPFIHAHAGLDLKFGWHVHLPEAAASHAGPSELQHLTHQGEAPEVSVPPALGREVQWLPADLPASLVALIAACAWLACADVAAARIPRVFASPVRRLAGLPPPALSPPLPA